MNVQHIHLNPFDIGNTDDCCDGTQRKCSHANDVSTDEQRTQHRRQSVITLTNLTSALPSTSTSSTWDMQTETTINPTINTITSNTTTMPSSSDQPSPMSRMSMFFFRLHNLQREQENKRKKSVQQQRQRQRRGAKVFRSDSDTGHLTLAPSRLFEKTPIKPSDSLDEIALQIPRYL